MVNICIPTIKSKADITDLTDSIARTAGTGFRLIISSNGLASAAENRNLCLRDCNINDVIIMMDDDILPSSLREGWTHKLLGFLNKHPYAMVAPRLVAPSGKLEWHPRVLATRPFTKIARQQWVTSALICFKHTGLLFEESYLGSGFEDSAFCRARVLLGMRDFFVLEDLRIVHLSEKKGRSENWDLNSKIFTLISKEKSDAYKYEYRSEERYSRY